MSDPRFAPHKPHHVSWCPWLLLVAALAWGAPRAWADESFWTNNGAAVYYTNLNSWTGGVPGPGDTATFTNTAAATVIWAADVANANANFALANTTDTLRISNSTWTVTNQMIVGYGVNSGRTSTVSFTTGTLVVTNGSRSAALVIGQGSVGSFAMNGGTLKADYLLSSNNPPGVANSTLTLNSGNIETYRGSVVIQTNSNPFYIGASATGSPMNWAMLGGTNLIDGGINNGTYWQNGTITVSGSGTVLTNVRTVYIGRGGSSLGTRFVITNGGTAFNGTTYLNRDCTNVSVLVADGGKWYVGQLRFGDASTAANTELMVSNGGTVYSVGTGELTIGLGAAGTRMTVTGGGALYTNTIAGGAVILGQNLGSNKLSVLDGASFFSSQHLDIGYAAAATGNVLVVSGGSSMMRVGGNIFQRLGGGAVAVSNGGTLAVGGAFYLGSNGSYLAAGGGGNGLLAVIADGGVLQANSIYTGFNGTGILTNSGGTFRFTANSPTITTNTPGTIVVTNGTVEFAGVAAANLAGSLGFITYQGANTLALNGATNAILANYAVQGGSSFSTLDLRGAGSLFQSTNSFTIGTGGSLVGAGAVQSLVVSNAGTIAPGHSPGTLTFSSNVTLLDSSLLVLEIGGTNAADYDRLVVGGAMARAGTLTIITNGSWSFAVSNRFNLFDFASWSGGFAVTNLPSLDSSLKWDFTDFESQGILAVSLAIPEPSSLLAVGAGLALLAVLRRRRA